MGGGFPSGPSTPTTHEIERLVGDSLLPPSIPTTCEIEHLGSIWGVADCLLPIERLGSISRVGDSLLPLHPHYLQN